MKWLERVYSKQVLDMFILMIRSDHNNISAAYWLFRIAKVKAINGVC